MTRLNSCFLLIAILFQVLSTRSSSSQEQTKQPVYRPPVRGAPGGRIGGGTRAPVGDLPEVVALVPDHVGFTVKPTPTLFWYISTQTSHPIEITLIEAQAVKPLLEKRVVIKQAGIQRFPLDDHGVQLERGKQYKWFVVVILDPSHRSRDIVSGGMIEMVEPPAPVLHVTPAERPRVFADAGLWYDLLTALSDLIDESSDSWTLRTQRALLLDQIGLQAVAAIERQQAGTAR